MTVVWVKWWCSVKPRYEGDRHGVAPVAIDGGAFARMVLSLQAIRALLTVSENTMPSPVLQRIFHSFTLLISTALCGAVLGGVVGSLMGNSGGFDAIATVMGGIGLGGGAGLVLAAAVSMRASIETLIRYSRVSMVLAILFMAMLFVRRYRIEQSLREDQIEIVPVMLTSSVEVSAGGSGY